MPLERINPVFRRFDLGVLRLTQDELVEIVRLVQDMSDVEVRIESEGNTLTDISEDLPQLGPRVGYLSITATRAEGGARPSEVLSVSLSGNLCEITTTDPGPTTLGYIELIRSVVGSCRRMPRWQMRVFRSKGSWGAREYTPTALPGLVGMGCLVVGGLSIASILQRTDTGKNTPAFAWPISLILLIMSILLFTVIFIGYTVSKTVIYTSTRAATPTFWQRRRVDIAIHLVVGALFFLLGLLVGHG
jgi:hypothetical protein